MFVLESYFEEKKEIYIGTDSLVVCSHMVKWTGNATIYSDSVGM